MTVEVRLSGAKCNLQCVYCYQEPERASDKVKRGYDLTTIKRAIEAEGGPFNLFGGEPLLAPLEDLEELWAWGLERFGKNGVQTNGALITDAHIDLFRRYKVDVGISIDGPGSLNRLRWHGSEARTDKTTEQTLRAIDKLCERGHPPGLIVTLHRANATSATLPALETWFRALAANGIRSVRLHILESETAEIRRQYALSVEENVHAFRTLARLEAELVPALRFDVFADLERMLRGHADNTTCVWGACDPYTTGAVRGIEADGRRSNCGRTYKDGVAFMKAETRGFERQLALYNTPQEHGGCRGCRFFLMCKGQCPGTAIDGDWRNRSEHCDVWKALFEDAERRLVNKGIEPVSLSNKRPRIERELMARWVRR